MISTRLIGEYFVKYPEREFEFCDKWIHDGNIWLARAAIIHQLHYKKNTNFEKLKEFLTALYFISRDSDTTLIR